MKYVYLALCALGLFVVDAAPSSAQGACSGPNCRIELAAASTQDAIKKVDKKKSNQPVAKDTKKKNSTLGENSKLVDSSDPSLRCGANETKCQKDHHPYQSQYRGTIPR